MKTYKIDPLGKNRPLMLVRGTRLPESFPDSVAEHMAKSLKANCRGVFATINGEISSSTVSPGVVMSKEANEDNNTLVVMTEGIQNESVDWEDSTGKQFRLEHAGEFAGSQDGGHDTYYTGAHKDLRTFVTGAVPYTGQPLVAANAKQWYSYTTPEGVSLTFRGCIQAPVKDGTGFVGLKIDRINSHGLDDPTSFDLTLDCDSAVKLGLRNGMNDNSKPFNMRTGIGWLQIVATDDFKSHIHGFSEAAGNGDAEINPYGAYDGFTYNVIIRAINTGGWTHAGNTASFRVYVKSGSALEDSIVANTSGFACENNGLDMSGSGNTFPMVEEVSIASGADPTVVNLTWDNHKQIVVRFSSVQEGEQLHLDLSDTVTAPGVIKFCSMNANLLHTEVLGADKKNFVIDIPHGDDVFAFFGVSYNAAGTVTISRTVAQPEPEPGPGPEPVRTPGFYSADGQLIKAMTKEEVEQGSDYAHCPTQVNAAVKNATSFVWPEGVTAVGNNVFYECLGLTSLNIPSTVTSIGAGAFGSCTNLTSVTIPEGVTSIGNSAFSSCKGLTSVTIPSTVTSIGNSTFSGCTGLNPLTVPNTVTTIGTNAFKKVPKVIYGGTATGSPWGALEVVAPKPTPGFYSADGQLIKAMTKEEVEQDYSIVDYPASTNEAVKNATSFVWPEGVTRVGASAFEDCSGLTSVTIPEGVTSIDFGAFKNCSALTSVTISDGVTNIEDQAFKGCSGLTSVAIPSTVTSIGQFAFSGCTALPSVTIPEGVTSIGEYAFNGCSGLTSVTIPEGVTSIGESTFGNCSRLTSVTIPDGVTSIGKYAFGSCSALTSVTIPDSVTSIGEAAFSACSGLTSVTIPNTVTTIEQSAFAVCTSLNPLTVPNTVATIGINAFLNVPKVIYGGTATGSPWGAKEVVAPKPTPGFYNVSNELIKAMTKEEVETDYSKDNCPTATTQGVTIATKFVWPDGVTRVGANVFKGCTMLESVTIPEGVTSIGNDAFSLCMGLKSVTIPNTVTSIGTNAFTSCTGLTSVTIPEGVTSIGNTAFSGCSGLTSVTLPNTLTTIGDSVFNRCSGLTSVTIPKGVTSIGNSAFEGCTGLTSVTIQEGVTSIGSRAFAGCTSLTSVTIPEGVTSIGNDAFERCSGLTSVTIPSTVKTIGSDAFSYCTGLTSVTIPEGVTTINRWAFNGCTSLNPLTVPNTVTTIGTNAFKDVPKVIYGGTATGSPWGALEVVAPSTPDPGPNPDPGPGPEPGPGPDPEPTRDPGFYSAGGQLIKAMTKEEVEQDYRYNESPSYTNAEIKNATSFVWPDGVTKVGNNAFYECKGLTEVVIPEGVTSIGNSAFDSCSALTSVTIPSTVTSIGNGALSKCSALASVSIPSTVTSIGNSTFSYCTGLTSVTIPEGVTSIGSSAFSGCTGLTSVTIPSTVTSIGAFAFKKCSALNPLTVPNTVTTIGNDAFKNVPKVIYSGSATGSPWGATTVAAS